MVVRAYLLGLLGCALLLAGFSVPATAQKAAGDVTILLFHTADVERLHIQARSASLRFCRTCTEHRGPLSMEVHARDNAILDADGKPLRTIELAGEISLTTSDNRRAEAAGLWTVRAERDRLLVSVRISRERYVEAVLAAEAGAKEPPEFLKAMAVTARSYVAAVPARHADGAFCDTTHCQALRLEPVPQVLHDAVWETSGETLWYGNRQAVAYFSQNCGGWTEDASSAWGGPPVPWLTSHTDAWCARTPSQWHASLAVPEVQRALGSEGFPLTGSIQDIAVLTRDRSGRVRQVRLRDVGGSRTIPAAALRFALNRSLGWNQLRSDRYQVRRVGDRILFEGSGFGHGVGLCQAGATAMGRAGQSYRQILQAYFPGTVVRVRAHDAGWTTIASNGFSLRTTVPDAAVEQAATQAFADARSRWSEPLAVKPSLTIFPSTEAFRQATGQPGWDLAVTQGRYIAAQPAEVLRAHGGARSVLRHEFLHSFAEAEAAPTAPLWLREGLVGVLNGDNCQAQGAPSLGAVDTALRSATTLEHAQQAHSVACVATRRFIAEHGLNAAHGLLQHP